MNAIENTGYMICVRCFTYNQSQYIEDALNGFCMQQTSFPYVCIVVDDASTDGEQIVLESYLGEHFNHLELPDGKDNETEDYVLHFARHKTNENCFFVVVLLKKNHYSIKKDKTPYFKEWQDNSKYIALCEGDDYWIDTHKLQHQTDFLESHPDYTMVFHNALVRYQNKEKSDCILSQFKTGDFNTLLLFKKWQLPLASVLFRREILNASVFCELNKVYEGGFCFFITATIMGRVLGISKCLSVYRINDGGVSNNMHVWDIIDRRYRYAKVTKDKTVIKFVDGVALRRLIEVMPHYLIGNSDARKYVSVIKNHSKVSYYKSIIMFPFYLPKLMLRKLKKNDEQ